MQKLSSSVVARLVSVAGLNKVKPNINRGLLGFMLVQYCLIFYFNLKLG